MTRIKLCDDCSIPKDVQQTLINFTGACDPMDGVSVENSFTYADIHEITTNYLKSIGVEAFDPLMLHMSHVNSGDSFENVQGKVCFTSQEPVANKKFADWLDDNCVKTLGAGYEEKCDMLYDTVDFYAKEDPLISALKMAGEKLLGLAEMFAVFGPALYGYHKWQGNRAIKNGAKKAGSKVAKKTAKKAGSKVAQTAAKEAGKKAAKGAIMTGLKKGARAAAKGLPLIIGVAASLVLNVVLEDEAEAGMIENPTDLEDPAVDIYMNNMTENSKIYLKKTDCTYLLKKSIADSCGTSTWCYFGNFVINAR